MVKKIQHPGLFLHDLYVNRLGVSSAVIAAKLDLPKSTLDSLFSGRKRITMDLALRMARCFKTDVYYFVSLQQKYDMDIALRSVDLTRVRSIFNHGDNRPKRTKKPPSVN